LPSFELIILIICFSQYLLGIRRLLASYVLAIAVLGPKSIRASKGRYTASSRNSSSSQKHNFFFTFQRLNKFFIIDLIRFPIRVGNIKHHTFLYTFHGIIDSLWESFFNFAINAVNMVKSLFGLFDGLLGPF
jgi:hypothetical protein